MKRRERRKKKKKRRERRKKKKKRRERRKKKMKSKRKRMYLEIEPALLDDEEQFDSFRNGRQDALPLVDLVCEGCCIRRVFRCGQGDLIALQTF